MTTRITLSTGSDTSPFTLKTIFNGPSVNIAGFLWYSLPLSMITMETRLTDTIKFDSIFTLKAAKNNFIITETEARKI